MYYEYTHLRQLTPGTVFSKKTRSRPGDSRHGPFTTRGQQGSVEGQKYLKF